MVRIPVIDNGRCSKCLGCIEAAPDIFFYNRSLGIMQVQEKKTYPEELVEEAIKNCPENCIDWDTYADGNNSPPVKP